MLAGGGASIINTASYSALRGIKPLGQVAHAAAKGGVVAMTKSLATEGASEGIRVNAFSPGFVKLSATDAAVPKEGREYQLGNHLIKRPGPARTPPTWPPTSPPGLRARTSRSTAAPRPVSTEPMFIEA